MYTQDVARVVEAVGQGSANYNAATAESVVPLPTTLMVNVIASEPVEPPQDLDHHPLDQSLHPPHRQTLGPQRSLFAGRETEGEEEVDVAEEEGEEYS